MRCLLGSLKKYNSIHLSSYPPGRLWNDSIDSAQLAYEYYVNISSPKAEHFTHIFALITTLHKRVKQMMDKNLECDMVAS
jgi:hypothetical protein